LYLCNTYQIKIIQLLYKRANENNVYFSYVSNKFNVEIFIYRVSHLNLQTQLFLKLFVIPKNILNGTYFVSRGTSFDHHRFLDECAFVFLNGNRFSFRRITYFVKNSLTYMLTFQDHLRLFGPFKFSLRLEDFPY